MRWPDLPGEPGIDFGAIARVDDLLLSASDSSIRV